MHGLGEIIKMNRKLGNPYGYVGRNGGGTPWRVVWPDGAQNKRETNPFRVIRNSDGALLGAYPKLTFARRHVARLMEQEAARLVREAQRAA